MSDALWYVAVAAGASVWSLVMIVLGWAMARVAREDGETDE